VWPRSVSSRAPLQPHWRHTARERPRPDTPLALCDTERACKPNSVTPLGVDGHLSRARDCSAPRATYPRFGRATRGERRLATGRLLLLGLAPGGVCLADPVTRAAGGLLRHPFTLAPWRATEQPAFCCTCRRVASPGRYPAPCSAEFGLSSARLRRAAAVRLAQQLHHSTERHPCQRTQQLAFAVIKRTRRYSWPPYERVFATVARRTAARIASRAAGRAL